MTGSSVKESTKFCPHCKCDRLVQLPSQNVKLCPNCGAEIPWYLEPGQKSPMTGAVGEKNAK